MKINFKIQQGSTFKEIIRWESDVKSYRNITGITKSAPLVVTSAAHAIPAGWRIQISDVGGMKEINSLDTWHIATPISLDAIELNAVNSASYTAYTSGGIISFNTPIDLTGYTARMQIRQTLDSTSILEELTTTNGKIVVNSTLKTITLNIDAVTTAAYTWNTGVYSLEMISNTGVVETIATGTVTLVKEVTR
jgi:hypothetical protein